MTAGNPHGAIVVRGAPDDTELAALLAVLALVRPAPPRTAEPSRWAARGRTRPIYRAPGSWDANPYW